MRKNFIYILLLLYLVSCMNQKSNEATEAVMEDAELEQVEETATMTFEDVLPVTVQHKIQERLDALLLIKKHPEFKKTLQKDTAKNDVFTIDLPENFQKAEVTNVEAVSAPIQENEHSFSQNFTYTLRFDDIQKKTDTINVIVSRKPVTIDGERVFDTRFLFRSLK